MTDSASTTAPERSVEIVTIGDELLLGFTVDTNAAVIARELAAMGMSITRRSTVGDDAGAIQSAVREALDRAGAVITTGGLGPTSDDRTKPAIAALFGRELELDEAHLDWMRQRWRTRFGRELPEANRRQAMMPRGSRTLENRHGSAPGVWLEDERGRWVAMLPGVPREMRGMLADTLLPLLRDRVGDDGRVVRSRTLRSTGIAESLAADRIERAPALAEGVAIAYLPSVEGVDIRLTVRGHEVAAADALLESAAAVVRGAIGEWIYGEDGADLAAVVLDRCRAASRTLAVAESCTGGLLGGRLTAIPGSSDVFLGGVIAYADAVKESLLDVEATAIGQDGAVSERVARAMAEGARARTRADIALSVTGIAGPSGGTTDKPVGTVCIALALGDGTQAVRLRLWGDREEIRRRSAQAALELLRRRFA